MAEATYAIERALEYFEERADADLRGERFVGNEEMSIAQDLREALAAVSKPDPRLLSIVRKAALGSGVLRDEAHAVLKELGEL
jgi:hypothetical protein